MNGWNGRMEFFDTIVTSTLLYSVYYCIWGITQRGATAEKIRSRFIKQIRSVCSPMQTLDYSISLETGGTKLESLIMEREKDRERERERERERALKYAKICKTVKNKFPRGYLAKLKDLDSSRNNS